MGRYQVVTTYMSISLRTSKLFQYIINHFGQLSFSFFRVAACLAGVTAGCDYFCSVTDNSIWQVTLCSSEMGYYLEL